jgi:hypothetical protein
MAELHEIGDDEFLLRHVPGGTSWQAPGPRITSANFQLRQDRQETGVSVTRMNLTRPERLMQLVGGDPEKGSRIAMVRSGDVRLLGLKVVPKPTEEDAGHAEIQSGTSSLDDHACRKRLATLFRFVTDDRQPEGTSG